MNALSRLLLVAWLACAASGCARRVALDPEAIKERNSASWKVTSTPQTEAPAQK